MPSNFPLVGQLDSLTHDYIKPLTSHILCLKDAESITKPCFAIGQAVKEASA